MVPSAAIHVLADKVSSMEQYLTGELDYEVGKDYHSDLEQRVVELEKKIPIYTEAQELMTDIHADEIVSSQDYYREINAIKIDITKINNQITRILTILLKKK